MTEEDDKNVHAVALSALGASKGGLARAESMSPSERQAVAKKAALARWGTDLPKETHAGVLRTGKLPCAVLDNEKRVLSLTGISAAFGSKKRGANQGSPTELKGFPPFLANASLAPFISPELISVLSSPIVYKTKAGQRAYAYEADVLALICEAIMEAERKQALTPQQQRLAESARLLYKGLVRVGINGLIDEATGYQADRKRDALAEILERFIAKTLRPWVSTFPSDFYEEMFRLRGWAFDPHSLKRPILVGKLTDDIVYRRLAPGVRDELRAMVTRNENGRLATTLHRGLTEDTGHPKLREHLLVVTTLMRISSTWAEFMNHLNRALPRFGDTRPLALQNNGPSA